MIWNTQGYDAFDLKFQTIFKTTTLLLEINSFLMRCFVYSVFLSILVLSACSKAKSSRWMVIDLTLKSSVTGKPISVAVDIERRSGSYVPLGEDQLDRQELGQMKNGHFYYELPIAAKDHDWELILRQGGWFAGGSMLKDYRIPLNPRIKNVINIEWTPTHYLTLLTIKNTSCFDETDSLWVSYYNPYYETYTEEKLFLGCVDGVYYKPYDDRYIWTLDATSKFKYRSKKNGVETSGEMTFDLEIEKFNEFVLNY